MKSVLFTFLAFFFGNVAMACEPWQTDMKTYYSCNGGATRIEVNQCNLKDVQLVSTDDNLISHLKDAHAYPYRYDHVKGSIDHEALFRGLARYAILSTANLGSFESPADTGGNRFSVYRHESGYKLVVSTGPVDYRTDPKNSWYLPGDQIFSWYFGDCRDLTRQ